MISRASLHPKPSSQHLRSLLGVTLTHFSQNGCANPPPSFLLCIFGQQRSLPHCKSLHSSSFRGISSLIRLRLWAANEGKSKGISFLPLASVLFCPPRTVARSLWQRRRYRSLAFLEVSTCQRTDADGEVEGDCGARQAVGGRWQTRPSLNERGPG